MPQGAVWAFSELTELKASPDTKNPAGHSCARTGKLNRQTKHRTVLNPETETDTISELYSQAECSVVL
uniref:Uncharacterized protein n=1 Tax=Anguilla anguilla TaxID=7936 RepID=A0A0E9RWM3_ANGAN